MRTEIRQGRIYAGRLSGGKPAVVRVQHEGPELTHVVMLNSDLLGREGHIATSRLAEDFRLVSDGPEFTSGQVAGWLEHVDGVHITHCCREHGCKYGDAACPVAQGTAKQAYPCEFCEANACE
jgi:hypothetical protein